MEAKKDQVYTYVFKRGVSNGAIKYDLIENFEGLSEKEKDVLTMSSVYWVILISYLTLKHCQTLR